MVVQQRAADAWFMGAERAQRPATAREAWKNAQAAMAAEQSARVRGAARWLSGFPEFVENGHVCSFAIEGALFLRGEHPDWDAGRLVAELRPWRAWRLSLLSGSEEVAS